MCCRLVDVEKPSLLAAYFRPLEGTVAVEADGSSAIVRFADAQSLQEASNRVGGGIRGSFRVLRPAGLACTVPAQLDTDRRNKASSATGDGKFAEEGSTRETGVRRCLEEGHAVPKAGGSCRKGGAQGWEVHTEQSNGSLVACEGFKMWRSCSEDRGRCVAPSCQNENRGGSSSSHRVAGGVAYCKSESAVANIQREFEWCEVEGCGQSSDGEGWDEVTAWRQRFTRAKEDGWILLHGVNSANAFDLLEDDLEPGGVTVAPGARRGWRRQRARKQKGRVQVSDARERLRARGGAEVGGEGVMQS